MIRIAALQSKSRVDRLCGGEQRVDRSQHFWKPFILPGASQAGKTRRISRPFGRIHRVPRDHYGQERDRLLQNRFISALQDRAIGYERRSLLFAFQLQCSQQTW